MSLDQDLAQLGKFFEGRRAQIAERLAESPAGPVREETLAAAEALQSDLATVMSGLKEALHRHEQIAAASKAQIEAAKKNTAACARAYKDQLAKKAKPVIPEPRPSVDMGPLHTRIRNLLLGEFAPQPLPRRPVPEDPGSIGDDLPAMDADVPVVNLSLPLLPELARDVAGVSPQARALLQQNLAMEAYVASLLQAKRFTDIGRLLAAELPVREAVWWVGLCIQHAHSRGAGRTAAEKAALRAAIAWVLDPIGPNREGARAAGETAGPKNASGCLARAAGQRPIALATSRPGATEESAAQLVDRALRLTCPTPDDCPGLFVMLGLGVAARELSWKKLVAAPGTAASSPGEVRVAPSAQPAFSTGHGLGKQLLLDLELVAPPRIESEASEASDEDFQWETSGQWNSLGM